MTRRSTRHFQIESLEGRNAPSHFGAHALVARTLSHRDASSGHQEVRNLDNNDASGNDSGTDRSNDSGKDSGTDRSRGRG
jgi:hypothetical protein